MMGMSSTEWSRYLHETVGLPGPPEAINEEVVRRMLARYASDLPVIPGAVEAVRRLAATGRRLAVASSSNRPLIDAVLDRLGVADAFEATVSSEEVERGKPSPDVYLEAAGAGSTSARPPVPPSRTRRTGSAPRARPGCAWSRSPNRRFPPADDALALAARVIDALDELPAAVEAL